jgi:fructose-1,6-bisphosphatase I
MSDTTPNSPRHGWTLERHLFEQQRATPGATGDFTGLFQEIALAGRIIASQVRSAGLANLLGLTGDTNVQGEQVARLDELANETMIRCLQAGGHVCAMASEENEDLIDVPPERAKGRYVVLFDPLDGSSNIDVNVSIGTIFSVHRRVSPSGPGTAADCLQPGSAQVAAGYVMYGSSTVLVYTTGQGTHAFTLDPTVGEFFLSHEHIRTPARGKTYSVNEGNYASWHEGMQRWSDWIKQPDKASGRPYGHRYVGTLVADFHRTLLKGGVFAYPADRKNPEGKLRLLYEAAPMAMLAEQAGAAADTGRGRVLEVVPTALHQRVPLFLGSRDDVADVVRFARGEGP